MNEIENAIYRQNCEDYETLISRIQYQLSNITQELLFELETKLKLCSVEEKQKVVDIVRELQNLSNGKYSNSYAQECVIRIETRKSLMQNK